MTAPTSAIIQKRNAEMTALASADLLPADDKNCATELYASVGGTSMSSGSPIIIPLNNQICTSFPEVFTFDSNLLTINQYGLYNFYGKVTMTQAGGSAVAVLIAYLEEDPATGTFAIVPASETYFTLAPISAVSSSGIFVFTKFVSPGYRYRLRAAVQSGGSSYSNVANFCRLGCIRLFKQG